MTATCSTAPTEALHRKFGEDGFVFVRELLPRLPVATLCSDLTEQLERNGICRGAEGERLPTASRPDEVGAHSVSNVYAQVQRHEPFHELANMPTLLNLCATILNTDEVVSHPRRILRMSWPGQPDLTNAPHQDLLYVQGAEDTLTAWIPLHPIGFGNGGLALAAGSHRDGLRPIEQAPGDGGYGVADSSMPTSDWLTADYLPGDVVLFHSLLVHSGTVNNSGRIRLSVDFRYQSALDPVDALHLEPHPDDAGVPSWQEVTSGWNNTELVAVPPGIMVQPHIWEDDEISTWVDRIQSAPSRILCDPPS